ncbi:MAG TPA: holo-[acyl-carrier-protein] synthase [Clostridiaceae bacterium]|nr:holo-[acyl-carrier-protein] synthase [Clostridiaceae bacterium]
MRKKEGEWAMVLGIGIDLIEIHRVEKVFSTEDKKKRVFTASELLWLSDKKVESLAGVYAAKEALAKALGTGIREISFLHMEVLKDPLGKPLFNEVLLLPHLKRCFGEKNFRLHLSISHDRERATAMVVIEEG